MKFRPSIIAALLALAIIATAATYTTLDPYQLSVATRLVPPTFAHPLGTDEMGRDLLARFIIGTRYTLWTGLTTALLAGALGWLTAVAAARVRLLGRLVVVLAYAGFVLPGHLLAPTRAGRVLVAILCGLLWLPLLWIGLAVIALENPPSNSLVLAPLFAVAAAFILHRDDQARARLPTLISLMPWLVVWSVYAHAAIDSLGLGVQPPAPSWGTLLWVKSGSLLPNLVAGFSLFTLGFIALLVSADERTASETH